MAKDLNKVMVSGRLPREAEFRMTPGGGVPVLSFSVASNHRVRDGETWKEETEWFRVVVWRDMAERYSQLLHKGSHVMVEGRLQTRKWTDNQGQERYTTEVVASDIYLLGSKRTEGEGQAADVFEQDLEPAEIPF